MADCPTLPEAFKKYWCGNECLRTIVEPARFGEFGKAQKPKPPFVELVEVRDRLVKKTTGARFRVVTYRLCVVTCEVCSFDTDLLTCFAAQTSRGRVYRVEHNGTKNSELLDAVKVEHALDFYYVKDHRCNPCLKTQPKVSPTKASMSGTDVPRTTLSKSSRNPSVPPTSGMRTA